MRRAFALMLAAALIGCEQTPEPVAPLYEMAPVETRSIRVSVEAAGVIEAETTVEVKSKASGEILAVHAETGDLVEAGALLVEVDKRVPRNQLAEAEAALTAARARRSIAQTQLDRAKTLYETGTLTQADYETAQLEFANAQAQVVSSQVAVENARIAMEDTDVRAAITGTIIEKHVEPGSVISSPTRDVAGGTVLLRMADLTTVRVRTLVDETDIGKIRPGMPARVVVAAYPNQPFEGEVLKIEPQAILEQNVTRFAVLIRLENRADLLKPGMNAEVEIRVENREDVPTVPTMALRTASDIPATAVMLGIDEAELRRQLSADRSPHAPGMNGETSASGDRSVQIPDGVDSNELLGKRSNGESPTAEERHLMQRALQHQGDRAGADAAGDGAGSGYRFGAEYWVVAVRDGALVPTRVRTGLTDLEYSEVIEGLAPGDTVLVLPSTSLFEQQQRLQAFITERFGGTPFQAPGARR